MNLCWFYGIWNHSCKRQFIPRTRFRNLFNVLPSWSLPGWGMKLIGTACLMVRFGCFFALRAPRRIWRFSNPTCAAVANSSQPQRLSNPNATGKQIRDNKSCKKWLCKQEAPKPLGQVQRNLRCVQHQVPKGLHVSDSLKGAPRHGDSIHTGAPWKVLWAHRDHSSNPICQSQRHLHANRSLPHNKAALCAFY